MSTRSTDVIFLLGAGASVEAGIPASWPMIQQIEGLLKDDKEWQPFRELYHHVKSAIHYASGIRGVFENVPYNIETLVTTLYELERNEEHPLYPFIAAWNSRFLALAQPDFGAVKQFRLLILGQLKRWMFPDDTSKANYYRGLVGLQKELNFPLRLFSLNYDLSVEDLASGDFRVEAGFADWGSQHYWDFERFEEDGPVLPPEAYLYKLHGSINWKRDPGTKQLYSIKQVQNIVPDHMEVIFGRDFKMEAADPYLFYAYAFRRAAFQAKLIVVIGYGFADVHINKMLVQGIRGENAPNLCVVSRCESDKIGQKTCEITNQLDLPSCHHGQIKIQSGSAKEFLEKPDLADALRGLIPTGAGAPF